jgi:hypothetical protein
VPASQLPDFRATGLAIEHTPQELFLRRTVARDGLQAERREVALRPRMSCQNLPSLLVGCKNTAVFIPCVIGAIEDPLAAEEGRLVVRLGLCQPHEAGDVAPSWPGFVAANLVGGGLHWPVGVVEFLFAAAYSAVSFLTSVRRSGSAAVTICAKKPSRPDVTKSNRIGTAPGNGRKCCLFVLVAGKSLP